MEFNMTNLRSKVQPFLLVLLFVPIQAPGQSSLQEMVDAVSDSTLFATISSLQGFGSRSYLSSNVNQIAKWLRGKFLETGLTNVALDNFAYGTTVQTNVVATLPGSLYPDREIIVGGHIDSRGYSELDAPGADDDASGTAAVLEIARVLTASGYHPAATIRFIGFAAEEAGLIGSKHYAERAKTDARDIALMVNFDMIGYTSSSNPNRRVYIVNYPPDTTASALASSSMTSYTSLLPVLTTSYSQNVDSYSFVRQGYRGVNFIEFVFNPYYHSSGDVIDALDRSYVRDITRAGLATVVRSDEIVASSVSSPVALPTATALLQNYPNPFNPSTRIQYTVGAVRGQGSATSDW